MIDAVIFDLGSTIVHFDQLDTHRPWEDRLGLAPGTVWSTVRKMVDWSEIFVGADDTPLWSAVAARLGVPDAELSDFKRSLFDAQRLDSDMIEFVASLRPHIKTAALSNAPRAARKGTVEKFGLDNYFDAIVISAEIGVAKPDPDAYQETVRQLHTTPDRCVLVDDLTENIQAAEQLGIKGVLYEHPRQAIAATRSLISSS